MATAGLLPVYEIQFIDYFDPATQMWKAQATTLRWRSQGVWTCPVVVRIAVGGYIKGGPWHSACVESFRSIEWIPRTVAIESPAKRKCLAPAGVSERGDRIGRCVNGESRRQKWRRRGLRRVVRPSVVPPGGRRGIRD